jgi:signal transduction histidine kinase
LAVSCIHFSCPKNEKAFKLIYLVDGDEDALSVQDNGMGIAENDIDKIFHKYHRLATDLEGQGSGFIWQKNVKRCWWKYMG